MKLLLIAVFTFVSMLCLAQKPTQADIEKALRSTWDKPATSSSPKQTATIHSIKIGAADKANEQDRIDGIPAGALVTIARIDFTVRQYYNDQTTATHRIMNAKVYKDQFSEWSVMSNGMKTVETKSEPRQ